jgi:hypothetical protein
MISKSVAERAPYRQRMLPKETRVEKLVLFLFVGWNVELIP